MVDLQAITNGGTKTMLEEATIAEFKATLRGELLGPDDAGYEETRKLWNGMIDGTA